MKALEYYIPGVNLSEIDRETLLTFAKKHNDQYAVNIANNPGMQKDLQMTFIRVIHSETGGHFEMLETEDGNYAVYLPDAWHPVSYGGLQKAVYPYLAELLPPYKRDFERVPVSLLYE